MNIITAADYEEIRGLKARYFRYVDTKQWQRLNELFTTQARFDGFAFDCSTPEAFVANVAAFLHGVETVHQGFMPEFVEVNGSRVRGVWAMHDYLRWKPNSRSYRGMNVPGLCGIHGYGHYEDEYRKVNDRWLIDYQCLSRLRVDPVIAAGDDFDPPAEHLGTSDAWLS